MFIRNISDAPARDANRSRQPGTANFPFDAWKPSLTISRLAPQITRIHYDPALCRFLQFC